MANVIEILLNGSTLFQTEDGMFVWFYDSGYGGWDMMPVESRHACEIRELLQAGRLKLGEPEYEYWGNITVRRLHVCNDESQS